MKAATQKKNSVHCSQWAVGMVKATPPKAAPSKSCVARIHHRLVFTRSMKGLQTGLRIQGRYIHEV